MTKRERAKKQVCDKGRIVSQSEFAYMHKLSQPTISRWLNDKLKHKRFKMYDASVVEIGGKRFIKVN